MNTTRRTSCEGTSGPRCTRAQQMSPHRPQASRAEHMRSWRHAHARLVTTHLTNQGSPPMPTPHKCRVDDAEESAGDDEEGGEEADGGEAEGAAEGGAEDGAESGDSLDEAVASGRGGGGQLVGLRRAHAAPGVETGERPPFWFEPCEVWEIRGADITVSPKHRAAIGLVHADRGLSLRFPRFIRKRPDKSIAEATTPEQLAEMWRRQAQRA